MLAEKLKIPQRVREPEDEENQTSDGDIAQW